MWKTRVYFSGRSDFTIEPSYSCKSSRGPAFSSGKFSSSLISKWVWRAVAVQLLTLLTAAMCASAAWAQAGVMLHGNHPAAIAQLKATQAISPSRPLTMELTLALHNQVELKQLLADIQNPSSPEYHHWLTPDQFAQRFGPTAAQIDAATGWLKQQGFTVLNTNRQERFIKFSGTAAQAEKAFGVKLISNADGSRFGNTNDPVIPSSLSGVVSAVRGLDNLHAYRHVGPSNLGQTLQPSPSATSYSGNADSSIQLAFPDASVPDYMGIGFGPADLATFYDSSTLLQNGTNGGNGDCIALIEDSNYLPSAVSLFDSTFSLPAANVTNHFPTTNPGINSDEIETLLDIEWAHASAPGAPISVYIGNNDIVAPLQEAVNDNTCGAISISFSLCGFSSTFYKSQLDPIFAQAAAQGQSVFVATGDVGAAGITFNARLGGCVLSTTRGVSELAADPNVVAVGGTAVVSPNYSGSGNITGYQTEYAWDDGINGGASGGGASPIFPKPAFQFGTGVPADGRRDIPDVALAAGALQDPGFYIANDRSGTAVLQCCVGGTSIGTPIWAGISKLVAQQTGLRQGNMDPLLYDLGRGSSVFHDITLGNNNFNGVKGYSAGTGFDLVTGWGTPDIANLVSAAATLEESGIIPVNAALRITPRVIGFPRQIVLGTNGSTSPPRYLVLFNPKNARQNQTVTVEGINTTGDFAAQSGACVGPLAPGANCKVPVTFTPSSIGAVTGTITVSQNGVNSGTGATLRGNGVQGRLIIRPLRYAFGRVNVGTSSVTKTVTLLNKNPVAMALNGFSVGPGFTIESNTCGSVLPANGGTCTVGVAFTPSVQGSAAETLEIQDNAFGNPHYVHLVGNGCTETIGRFGTVANCSGVAN